MRKSLMGRVISMLLVVVMAFGMLPLSAFAEEPIATPESEPVVASQSFTVTFDANGGKGTMEQQSISTGNLTKNAFTYEGFSFKGWNTAKNGTGVTYADGAVITLTENITLYAQWKDEYYTVLSEKNWDIAPGITETEIVLNNSTGTRRQVLHIMEADMNNPYTKVTTSYTNMDTKNYAVSNMQVQANWVRDNWGWNVVGAMNTCLSWYNSAAYAQDPSRVNEPLGFMMIDSQIYFDHSVGFPTVLVIHKDVNDEGVSRPESIPKVQMRTVKSTDDLNGWEDQVIPCSSGFIVENGVNKSAVSHGGNDAPRSVVGIKPDGTVVIMMNDGRQNLLSMGMTMYELADVMISLGCSYAVNCDGGGSSTFLSQRPGTSGLAVNCSPSDGALRETTSGILIISTAPATGEFSKAYITSEYDYYVPNSVVELAAAGLDFSGAAAEIPAEAVWTLSDDSFGTVVNGVFTSTGKTGAVDVQLVYNDEVVGSKTLNIVNPESVSFKQESTVIPYGKTISLDIEATYGIFPVGYVADSFEWTLSNEAAGVRDGLSYTATTDNSVTGVVITAVYKYADLDDMVLTVSFGKGSEVMWDFEDGDISNWLGQYQIFDWLTENGVNKSNLFDGGFGSGAGGNYSEDNETKTFLSTRENGGQVKNGNYALGLEVDYRHSQFSTWSYAVLFNVEGQTVLRDVANGKNATKLGMWVYIPEGQNVGKDLKGLAMQYQLYCATSAEAMEQALKTAIEKKTTLADANKFSGHLVTASGKNLANLTEADIPEDRWVYFYIDLTAHNYVALQNPQNYYWREPSFIRFYTQHYTPKNLVFYFDDMTLDYSDAVDDRDAPIISNITVNVSGNNRRSFNATVADFAASNTSGLNYSTAMVYVDGVALAGVSASGSVISCPEVELTSGKHIVTFEIADNLGNISKKSHSFTIDGTAPVTIGGHNDLNNAPEYDSVYYVDINVAEIEKIDSITAEIDLNTAHNWEIEGIVAAEGFTATASVNKYANTVTVTVTRTGESTLTGAQTLVSIPSRIWSWDLNYPLVSDGQNADTKDEIFATGLCPVVPYDSKVVSGSVTFVDGAYDGYIGTFGGSISVITNLDDNKNPWHDHTVIEIDDQKPTCLLPGYTDRTYCEGCGSVIDWGTVLPATGHTFDFVDGILKCSCGKLFTGVYTDGKEYVDGVAVSDGWVGESYFADGVKLTGVHKLPAPDGSAEYFYEFDANGVCANNAKYTGVFLDGDVYRYSYMGLIKTGWNLIGEDWYYFRTSTQAAATGRMSFAWMFNHDVYYEFDETGKLIKGGWIETDEGSMYYYGPDYYRHGWKTIDGKSYYFKDNYYHKGYNYVVASNSTVAQWYDFGEDGALVGELDITGYVVTKEGPFYVVDGVSRRGLFEYEGGFYYVKSTGSLAKGSYTVSITNDLMPFGTYNFDENGKMILKNGLVEEDGVVYYYVNDVKTYGGLVKIGEDFYYIKSDYQPAVGVYYVSKTNDLLPVGNYTFGEDGKMVQGVIEVDGKLYYYDKGVKRTDGLFKVGNDYYYARSNGQLAVGAYYAGRNNDVLPVNTYTFGVDGKMLQGVVEVDGALYYYELGNKRMDGLFKVGNDYYYARSNGQLATGQYYAGRNNDVLPVNMYTFGADGKMLQGVVEIDGALYYYDTGIKFCGGLFQIGEDYYYAKSNGKLAIGEYYAGRNNNVLPVAVYTFGPDGKMYNGIENIDGKLYYYETGVKCYAGLIEIDGDIYYVRSNYQLATGRYYVGGKTNGLLPAGYYTFDSDGKLIK